MSTILFFSLYRFYTSLRKINLNFEVDKCILTVHIVAFVLPVLAEFVYVILILRFNQVSLFTSSEAESYYWNVLGPSIFYVVTMGSIQLLQLILITNYSVKASTRNTQDPNITERARALDCHIEHLLKSYRDSLMNSMRFDHSNSQPSVELSARPSIT